MASNNEHCCTGVVYDDRLSTHYNAWNKDFTETPLRVIKCIDRCREMGLLDRCKRIPVREATDKEILTCHSKKHLETLQSTQFMSEDELKAISQKYDYIYFHKQSYQNAKLALGGTIDLVESIVTGKVKNGMAIVRPPGHHAMEEEYCGYCYFSNAAIATQIMLDKYHLKRILLLDWDVHHGQGSQFKFYNDSRVLFVSIHRYEHGGEWPYLRESDYDFIGEDHGKGYTINIPLNELGLGDSEYLAIFFNLLLPIFYEFDPELVLVSAGYDCAIGCPEGEMAVTPACFAHFVNMLMPLATGKVGLILEGGYNLKSLSESVALSLRALLGDPTPKIPPISAARQSVVESILNCIKMLHPYWHSLQYQELVKVQDIQVEQYPFLSVLHLPPLHDIKFCTPENRPETFPLLQECTDEITTSQLEEIDRKIEEAIKNTSITFTNTKLSITFDKLGSSVLTAAYTVLKSQSLSLIKDVLSELPSASESIESSAECILSNKTQCSMSIVQCQNFQSVYGSSTGHISNLEVATKYIMDSHHLKLLVIDLGTGVDDPPALSDHYSSVLYISLKLSGKNNSFNGTENSGNKIPQKLSFYHIEISLNDIVSDSDIMASFIQVILPVSYEFCPDFIILKWKNSASDVKESQSFITPACLGHMIQLLKGLAQGKLLMIFELERFQSTLDNDYVITRNTGTYNDINMCSKMVAECINIILGGGCGPLTKELVKESTISHIKQIQDFLQQTWTIFQFRCKIPLLNCLS